MHQFSLYQNRSDNSLAYPFLVDIQSDLLQSLTTRLVIPLTPRHLFEGKVPISLCPSIQLEEGEFILMTQYMSSIPTSVLTSPVGSLETFRTEIIQAVDLLITGV
jgi:toxin CcdB